MTSDAASLHCPNCGSPAGPGDQTCQYCQAALATVSCPACFALMFDGSAYCPHCGARRDRTAGGGRTARCPGCAGVMREAQIGSTALVECERCHAMWIDAATFERICADREAQASVLHQWPVYAGQAGPAGSRPPAGEVKYRRCVACGKMMNRMNFGRLSGTIVDVCKGHGTFLDAGELHLIVTFIQSGGLDRARQRQLDDLKEEEQRLRALQGHRDAGADQAVDSYRSWTGLDLLTLLQHLKGHR